MCDVGASEHEQVHNIHALFICSISLAIFGFFELDYR